MKTLKSYQITFLVFVLLLFISPVQVFSNHLMNDCKDEKTNQEEIFILKNQLISHVMKLDTSRGCIEGDCQNGVGVYVHNDGTRYEGGFKNGLADGKGTCLYANGNMYSGDWEKHHYHGYGILYKSDGTVSKGMWIKGVFIGETEKNVAPPILPKTWILAVGVARYNNFRSLKYTDDDVYRAYAFFKSPEGGEMPNKRITVLVDEDASYESIIDELLSFKDKTEEDDTFIFYFSGHIHNGHLFPINADTLNRKQISFTMLNDILSEFKTQNKIAIIDGKNYKPSNKSIYKEIFNGTDVTYLMASKENEFVNESNALRQALFSHFLIRGLKGGADANNDKRITVTELFEYIKANVMYYTNNYQTPMMYGKLPKDIPIGIVR